MMTLKSKSNPVFTEFQSCTDDMLVSFAEIKQFLRIENYDDAKLIPYYESAVNFLENFLKRHLQLKTFRGIIYYLNKNKINLPHHPIHNIDNITYLCNNKKVTLNNTQYSCARSMVYFKVFEVVFSPEIVITYQTGYTAKTLPKAIKQAILEYILFSFNHEKQLPDSILKLLKPFKIINL